MTLIVCLNIVLATALTIAFELMGNHQSSVEAKFVAVRTPWIARMVVLHRALITIHLSSIVLEIGGLAMLVDAKTPWELEAFLVEFVLVHLGDVLVSSFDVQPYAK